MNRIRHAYLDLAPELEPYFVTSKHDDHQGVLLSTLATPLVTPHVQGFVAIPGVIAVLDSVVAGAVTAIAALGLAAGTAVTLIVGVVTFAITVAAFVAFAVWAITHLRRRIVVRFPTPEWP